MIKYVGGIPWVVGFEKKPPYKAKANPPNWDFELTADTREELVVKMEEHAKEVIAVATKKICGSTAPHKTGLANRVTPLVEDEDV